MGDTGASGHGEIVVDVAIVGAGPAGLTAGYLLSKAGKRVAIVEKDPGYVGGLSRTIEHEGCRFGLGGRGFFSRNQAVAELSNELLPGGFIERPRGSRLYFEGKFHSYPLRSAAGTVSGLWAGLFRIKNVKTLRDWIGNRFGRQLEARFVNAYAEKAWGLSCDRMSADRATEQLEELGPWRAKSEGYDTFRCPRPGQPTQWETARDRIVEQGGIVLMGHSLKQLASVGQGGWRMTASGPDGEVVITAGHAVSSAPLRELAARLYPLPLGTIEASRLKYRDLLTVALMIGSGEPLAGTSIYVHDSKIKASRVRDLWSPDADVACIGFDYFCSENDGLWSMRDDKLIELARREMDMLGLASSGKVIGCKVVRQEKAGPVHDEGYTANLAAILAELADKHPTLHLVGRNGTHRCGDQDYAMTTAMLTVENILTGDRVHDVWDVEQASLGASGSIGDQAVVAAREASQRLPEGRKAA